MTDRTPSPQSVVVPLEDWRHVIGALKNAKARLPMGAAIGNVAYHPAITDLRTTQAERQRDELRKALGDVLFVRKDNPKESDRWLLEETSRISRIAIANQGADQ